MAACALAAVCVIPGILFTAPWRAAEAAQAPATRKAGASNPPERRGRDFVGRADQKRDQRKLYSFDSTSYRITTDVDKHLANDVAAHMDAVFKEYNERFGRAGFKPNPLAAVKPGERMPLYVLRKRGDYEDFLSGFDVNAKNTAGVFFRTRKGSGLATWVEGQQRLAMYGVLQHEGFHQFADAGIMNGLPPWVNEGVADYFGEGVVVDGKLRLGLLDRERLRRVRRAVKAGEALGFGKLMGMDNAEWNKRVAAGDASAPLLYDQAWSVSHYLIHGGEGGGPLRTEVRGTRVDALEAYLRILNDEYVRNPKKDARPAAFKEVFSNNLRSFRNQWEEGLKALKPDPWLSSVRHVQILASAIEALHRKNVKVDSIEQLQAMLRKELFRDFPKPAEAELVESDDAKLPPGVLVTGAAKDMPDIRLAWTMNRDGALEEAITFEQSSRRAKKPAPATSPTTLTTTGGPGKPKASASVKPGKPKPVAD
jgi:hypothetical protein